LERIARCRPLSTDPVIQAPSYAQDEGASGAADGWWCELPHATAIPTGFVTLHRYVSTLPHTYALYITQYAPRGTTPTSATAGPVITLEVDASSGVLPPHHLRYEHHRHGRPVRLGGRLTAAVLITSHLVSVIWRLPRAGVPHYLSGVTTVTVSGHDVPKATVVAVAKSVKPD